MENLKIIKNRIKTVNSIARATNAMKMVSTVKLTKTNSLNKALKECCDILFGMLSQAIGEARFENCLESDFWTERKDGKTLVIVLSTNQGFCGSFNQAIICEAQKIIGSCKEAYVKIFGKKGKVLGVQVDKTEFESNIENLAQDLAKIALEYIMNRNVTEVIVISSEKKNAISQIVKQTKILPIDVKNVINTRYIEIEGSKKEFINSVFNTYILKLFKKLITEHRISELTARVMATDNVFRNANEISNGLSFLHNSIRQIKITQELTEIVAGMECV
ncbi:MAG: F0F1 ATP synthase subunit gamma [Holosporales bacterium]|jgi:F-type H+-transporting ATPase subunit gamma|nr:F0F1 ATP synthase subunit gamma [Holosporales bacterium]